MAWSSLDRRFPVPAAAAARAIADGIEERRARIWLPRHLRAQFLLADALQALDDCLARRLDVPATVRLAESDKPFNG